MDAQRLMTDINIAFPEVSTALFALWVLVYGAFKSKNIFKSVTISACIFTAVLVPVLFYLTKDYTNPQIAFGGLYVQDTFSLVLKAFIAAGCFVALIFMFFDMQETGIARFEAPVLVVLSMLGMFFMVSSHNFLTLYVGLEMQSLALYILASFNRHSTRAPEAGMKYFILGALASGMLLFGISFIYGFAGHTGFDVVASSFVTGQVHEGILVGLVFVLIGIAFKLSAVPFHMWTPDVYQGAPASVTAFFAMVPKIAAMALLIRVCMSAFGDLQEQWVQVVYFLSAASMVVGAFAGLAQKNIRRLLAYSAIGNMGYALMGLVALQNGGMQAIIIYMFLYMVMTAGVFGILTSLRHSELSIEALSDLSGLSKTHPFYAYVMAIMMFSMAGIPPLAGFFGKLVVFNAAVGAGFISLAILGVITSVIASFYYLRVIKIMFFDDINIEQEDVRVLNVLPLRLILVASTIIICCFVFMPEALLDISNQMVIKF